MAHRTNVAGWERLTTAEARELGIAPSSRPYVDPSGNVVPYNQFLNAQAQQSGFRSFAQWRGVQEKMRREIMVEQEKGRNAGTANVKERFSLGGDLLRQWREAMLGPDGRTLRTRQQMSSSPGDPLANYLEALGVRQKNAPYAVGDTP